METLSRCRICLVSGVRMDLIINTYLQHIFEQLTSVPFQKEDGRPLFVCYICKARLKNCHEMRENSLRSEKYFTELLNNHIKPTPLPYINKLQIVSLTSLNCVPVAMNNVDDVKRESLEINDVQVKEENIEVTEDNPIDKADSILNTELEDKFKTEDFSIEDNDIIHTVETNDNVDYSLPLQLKSDKQILEDNIEVDYNAPSAQFKDVHPTNMNSNKTSVPVAEELKPLVVNESQIITTNKHEMEVTFGKNKNVKKSTQEMNKDAGKNIPAIATEIVDTSGHLQTKIYKCDTCEKCFTQRSTLVQHARVHTGEKPYRCDICEKCFSCKSGLVRHTRIHSGVKPYRCDPCKKCFSKKSKVRHTRIHSGVKPYTCDICEECFSQRSHLMQHARIHTGEKPYRCDICEKCFTQHSTLVQHARVHTGEKPYRCDICEKCFSFKSNLVKHARVHTGEKPYRCDICEKCFTQHSNLVQHARVHTGEKPYRCEICEECFSQRSHLVQHARIHSGVKPYRCDICEKCFISKSNLVQHARVHTGEKPYRCDIQKK